MAGTTTEAAGRGARLVPSPCGSKFTIDELRLPRRSRHCPRGWSGVTTIFLYRGVSSRFHRDANGLLKPKVMGPFTYNFHWGESGAYWGVITWGSSETNAVIRHQVNQEVFPTSGISTTPHLERAILYARGKDGLSEGFVYKIARANLKQRGVREFAVAQYTKFPSVPEDNEVILVTLESVPLPKELVVETIPVFAAPMKLSNSAPHSEPLEQRSLWHSSSRRPGGRER